MNLRELRALIGYLSLLKRYLQILEARVVNPDALQFTSDTIKN